jgi:TolA-binding protein
VPVQAHVKEHPVWFHRFDAVWTPTILLFDDAGKERVRLEGYLPTRDFNAALRCGLGRLAFVRKQFADAERWYDEVVTRFTESHVAAEAMFWRGVSRYSATHDHAVLKNVAEDLQKTYPASGWAVKVLPWL